jgi:hypothetical protein
MLLFAANVSSSQIFSRPYFNILQPIFLAACGMFMLFTLIKHWDAVGEREIAP